MNGSYELNSIHLQIFTGGRLPGHVEGLLEVCQRFRNGKKAKRSTYLGCILMGRKYHGQRGMGRKGVEEVGSKLYLFGCQQKDLGKFHPLTT